MCIVAKGHLHADKIQQYQTSTTGVYKSPSVWLTPPRGVSINSFRLQVKKGGKSFRLADACYKLMWVLIGKFLSNPSPCWTWKHSMLSNLLLWFKFKFKIFIVSTASSPRRMGLLWQTRPVAITEVPTRWPTSCRQDFEMSFFSITNTEMRRKFHCCLFLMVQLIISQYWFKYWLGAIQVTCHLPEPMLTKISDIIWYFLDTVS